MLRHHYRSKVFDNQINNISDVIEEAIQCEEIRKCLYNLYLKIVNHIDEECQMNTLYIQKSKENIIIKELYITREELGKLRISEEYREIKDTLINELLLINNKHKLIVTLKNIFEQVQITDDQIKEKEDEEVMKISKLENSIYLDNIDVKKTMHDFQCLNSVSLSLTNKLQKDIIEFESKKFLKKYLTYE